MDILKRLSGWTDGMSNADVYKLAHDEIALLRAQLAAQHTPSQSEQNQGEAMAIMEVISTVSKHLATTTPAYKQLKMLISYDKIPVGTKLYTNSKPTSQDAERWRECLSNPDIAIMFMKDPHGDANPSANGWVEYDTEIKVIEAINAAMKESK